MDDDDRSSKELLFSRTLREDGALIWELPTRITQQTENRIRALRSITQCFQKSLNDVSHRHFRLLVAQLLEGMGVIHHKEWTRVAVDICQELNGMMSSRPVSDRSLLLSKDKLKIELLPDNGTPADSCVISGVLLRRNIAHRRMRTSIHRPKLLLLSGALEYECTKLTQLRTVITRETEFLDAAVDRILTAAPDVCIVERSASHLVIERLRSADVTVVYNVPMSDMTKLAITTHTKIAENVLDVDASCIGTCAEFYLLRVHQPKPQTASIRRLPPPLMVFEVDSDVSACAVALRGASASELIQVKKTLLFCIFASYSLVFENAFLRDALSMTIESAAAFGVQGLPNEISEDKWISISKEMIQESAGKTRQKRSIRDCIDFVSPHTSGWTPDQTHQAFKQKREFSPPRYTPSEDFDEELMGSVHLKSTQSTIISKISEEESEERKGTPDVQLAMSIDGIVHYESKDGCGQVLHGDEGMEKAASSRRTSGEVTESYSGRPTTSTELDCFSRDVEDSNGDRLIRWTSVENPSSVHGRQDTEDSFPSVWNDWSDVERFRNGRSMSANYTSLNQPLSEDDRCGSHVLKSNKASRKLRVMESRRFSASFANRNHWKRLMCNPCHVMPIDSSGDMELTLMEYLMSITADAPIRCPAGCGGGNSSHHRTFLHGAIRITISVVSLPDDKAYPEGTSDIWFWTRPKGVSTKPMETVTQVLLSEDAKCLSLAQFLQLMCNTQYLKVFGRSLFLEHVVYFGYGRTAVCMHGDRVRLKPVCMPPKVLDCKQDLQINWLKTSVAHLIQETHLVFGAIEKSCFPSVVTPSAKSPAQSFFESYIRSSLIPDLLKEKEKLIEDANELSDSVCSNKIDQDQILESYLQLNQLWRTLGISVLSFSATVNDPHAAASMNMDQPFEDISLSISTRISDSLVSDVPRDEFLSASKNWRPPLSQKTSPGIQAPLQDDKTVNDGEGRGDVNSPSDWNSDSSEHGHPMNFDDTMMNSPFLSMVDQPFPATPFLSVPEQDWMSKGRTDRKEAALKPILPSFDPPIDLIRSRSIQPTINGGDTVDIKRSPSMDKLIELFDRETRHLLEEENNLFAVQQRSVSLPSSPREFRLLNQLDRRLNLELGCEESEGDSDSVDGGQQLTPLPSRSSLKRSQTPGSKTPMPGTEIRLGCRSLIPLGNDDLVIPVFDAEPTSIIAHVLASISYHKDLQHCFENLVSQQDRLTDLSGDLDGMSDAALLNRTTSTSRFGLSRSSNQFHIVTNFEDKPPIMMASKAKFEVVSYFAPQFTKMRGRCINGGERSFVMSMSRSRRWETSGGKSNAYFAKTLDDRYIIKSVSKVEKAAFLDKLGPNYFGYMEAQHHADQDVALVKCLGLYHVSMKSYSSRHTRMENGAEADLGRDWGLDLIIMENVFYGYNCTSIYDLKGSHRGRFNDEAEKKAGDRKGVYLDANLRKQIASDAPFLVDQETLDKLAEVLRRDTNFLASNSVMDYSLLAGVDAESNRLVIAIIDYARQYTLDKRVEYLVKSSGLIGDGNEAPTIIPPVHYRDRFLTSILGYFTVVPRM